MEREWDSRPPLTPLPNGPGSGRPESDALANKRASTAPVPKEDQRSNKKVQQQAIGPEALISNAVNFNPSIM